MARNPRKNRQQSVLGAPKDGWVPAAEAQKEPATYGTASEKTRFQIGPQLWLSEKEHTRLVNFINNRLQSFETVRGALVEKFENIDREYFGFIQLDEDDKKRDRDNKRGKGPYPTDLNLPLVQSQIEDATTYMLSVMTPDTGMYSATASKAQQTIANGIVSLMNQHGEIFSHYLGYAKAFQDALRYNLGGVFLSWELVYGNKIGDRNGAPEITKTIVRSGNSIRALDPYNFSWDPAVKAVDIATKAEWCAEFEILTPFAVVRMEKNDEIFGAIEHCISMDDSGRYKAKVGSAAAHSYFRPRPVITVGNSGDSVVNWENTLTLGAIRDSNDAVEMTTFYTWILPKEFGLGDAEDLQIWRFAMLNGSYIVSAEHLNNAHAFLPVAIGQPAENGFGLQEKSDAERLIPLQRFASFQMNTHQRAARKALYGITIYDQDIMPAMGGDIDMTHAKIPAKMTRGSNMPISQAVHQINDVPPTQNTMNDIAAVMEIMQKILPTDLLKNMTDLQRATQYQAAAVVQSGNRKNHTKAKILNNQMMAPCRWMQLYNIRQYQETVTVINDETGEEQELNPAELRTTNIEFVISDGLKGIDKMLIIENIKEIINAVLQSKVAQGEIDVIGLIDYWTNLLGEKYDFKQFKHPTPLDGLDPESKQIAFQLLQQYMQQQKGGKGGAPGAPGAPAVQNGQGPWGGGGRPVMPGQPIG
jgi:hypothetical protein